MAEDAARKHSEQSEVHAEDDWHRPWLMLPLTALVGAVLVIAVVGMPREGARLPDIARHAMRIALPTWGTTEPVNEIVYGSRGFDTFGETFLLLAAVVATVVLTRGREARSEYVGEASAGLREQSETDPGGEEDKDESEARSAEETEEDESDEEDTALDNPDDVPLGVPSPERSHAMTVIVRGAARSASVILAVAGVYLAAWGYTPGGGFPAGLVLAGVAILLYAALGHPAVAKVVRPAVLEPIEMAGATVIIATGLIAIVRKGSFLTNWLPLASQQTIRAGGTLQIFSGAELIEVATGITIAIFGLLGMRHEWAPDEEDEDDDEDSE